VDLFLADERLRFRGLVVPVKGRLDHARFDQSHDDWYYKMYFTMLRPIFCAPHRYRIYLDVKDTRGGPKVQPGPDFRMLIFGVIPVDRVDDGGALIADRTEPMDEGAAFGLWRRPTGNEK